MIKSFVNVIMLSLICNSSFAYDKQLEAENMCTNVASKKPMNQRENIKQNCIKEMLTPAPDMSMKHKQEEQNYKNTERNCKMLYGKDSNLKQSMNNSWFGKECRSYGFIR